MLTHTEVYLGGQSGLYRNLEEESKLLKIVSKIGLKVINNIAIFTTSTF